MNDFNLDQKPHILSIPESLEGGGGFRNDSSEGEKVKKAISKKQKRKQAQKLARQQLGGPHSIAVTTPDQEVDTNPEVEEGEVSSDLDLEGLQAALETMEDENSSTTEGGSELDPDSLNFDLDELVDQGIEESKPKFEVNEDGLSVQGAEIQGIKSQIQQLENGQGEAFDAIQDEILQSRQESRISLENQKTTFSGIQEQLLQMIEKAYNKLKEKDPNSTESIKEFTEKARSKPQFGKAITDNEDSLLKVAKELQTFDQETKTQVQTAIQKRLEDLKGELTESQASYAETGAEENDKKVLLERQLEGQLTDPNNLFSPDNINQIFATYGLKEGRDRLQQLQEQSDKAREQAAHDEIRNEIVSQIHYHLDSRKSLFQQELVDAISLDMQSQLEVLLEELEENSEEYREINRALQSYGEYRISEIANSRNPKLQELVFWHLVNLEGGKTTAEILGDDKNNNNLAKYVAKETDRQYKEQELQIKKGELNKQVYLHSKSDNERREQITGRIATEFDRAKQAEVNRIYSDEIYPLEEQKSKLESEVGNERRLASEQSQAEAQIEPFKVELTQLDRNQLKLEDGKFQLMEDITARQQSISQESEKIKQNIKIEITNNDNIPVNIKQLLTKEQDPDKISTLLANKVQDLSKRKRNTWLKPLGFRMDGEQIDALTNLQQSVNTQVENYNTLQAEKKSNLERYKATSQIKTELTRIYQSLPKSIQSALNALSNPDVATIMQTIDAELSQIQVSKTEAGIKASEREKQIADLTEQITTLTSKREETKAIKLSG